MKTGVDLKQFKKWVAKDWGKRCGDYAFGCYVCAAWRVFDDLKALIDISEGYDKESKTKKKGR